MIPQQIWDIIRQEASGKTSITTSLNLNQFQNQFQNLPHRMVIGMMAILQEVIVPQHQEEVLSMNILVA
jgi:hypothetical protein